MDDKKTVWLLSVMRVNLTDGIFENGLPEAYSTRELAQEAMNQIINDEADAFGDDPERFENFAEETHEEAKVFLTDDAWCEVRIDEAVVDELVVKGE